VGNAWGGHVGLVFAAQEPERCRSLVTIGTPVRALTPAERRRIVPLVALYRLLGPVRLLVKGVEDALLGAKPPPTDAHMISSALRGVDRRGMHAATRSVMLRRPDLTSVLAPLETPTLIVAAEQDALWQPTEACSAAGHFPHRAFGTVPGAGHVAPLLQHAPALAELVCDFWQDPDAFTTRQRRLT
jgi:pimeloyl-ACP methyl ester carboxylesterase